MLDFSPIAKFLAINALGSGLARAFFILLRRYNCSNRNSDSALILQIPSNSRNRRTISRCNTIRVTFGESVECAPKSETRRITSQLTHLEIYRCPHPGVLYPVPHSFSALLLAVSSYTTLIGTDTFVGTNQSEVRVLTNARRQLRYFNNRQNISIA